MQKIQPLIIDADMGGDDAWLIAMTLACADRFKMLGLSTVFGNVDVKTATRNATAFLNAMGCPDIPVHMGANDPVKPPRMMGDNAFGDDGFGGIKLGKSRAPNSEEAVLWMARTLHDSSEKITIFASGPLTNIAHLVREYPGMLTKIKHLHVMGGAIKPGPFPNPKTRIGNITEFAEFNIFQDPEALNIVAASGIPMTLMTMDATQGFNLTPARIAQLNNMGPAVQAFVKMLEPAMQYDGPKFGAEGPFVHDSHILMQALNPLHYNQPKRVSLRAVFDAKTATDYHRHGMIVAKPTVGSPVFLVRKLKYPDAVFEDMAHTLDRATHRLAL